MNPSHPVDKIVTKWTCSKCGETRECHVSDLTESGIPICSDCKDDMELAPLAQLEPPTPGDADPARAVARVFDSLNRVDWNLLYQQKRALVECLDSRQLTPAQGEHLGGILELLDALQDDAESAGCWTHPRATSS